MGSAAPVTMTLLVPSYSMLMMAMLRAWAGSGFVAWITGWLVGLLEDRMQAAAAVEFQLRTHKNQIIVAKIKCE